MQNTLPDKMFRYLKYLENFQILEENTSKYLYNFEDENNLSNLTPILKPKRRPTNLATKIKLYGKNTS